MRTSANCRPNWTRCMGTLRCRRNCAPCSRTAAGHCEASFSKPPGTSRNFEPRRTITSSLTCAARPPRWTGAWSHLDGEILSRSKMDYAPVSTRQDAEQIAGQVKLALDLLRPHMEEARAKLAKLSPKISEFAAALAKEQQEAKDETAKE